MIPAIPFFLQEKTLAGKRVRLYLTDIAPFYDPCLEKELLPVFSKERQEKVKRLQVPAARARSLAAGYLTLLAKNAEHTNLSHSGSKAICVSCEWPIGCDVQKMEQDYATCAMVAERFYSPKEQEQLTSCKTKEEYTDLFYRLWALKESFQKATGEGMGIPLSSFSVLLEEKGPRLEQSFNQKDYVLTEFDVGEGYKCAACVEMSSR